MASIAMIGIGRTRLASAGFDAFSGANVGACFAGTNMNVWKI